MVVVKLLRGDWTKGRPQVQVVDPSAHWGDRETTKDHKRAVSMGDAKNANAVRWMRTGHSMNWNATAVVNRASR